MSNVTFFIMPETTTNDNELDVFQYACHLTAQLYQQKQRVLVLTDNVADAEKMDELLWQLPPELFVAHNLQGEGPQFGTPVEIGPNPAKTRRNVLVNLTQNMPNFCHQFQTIYDFVPSPDAPKQIARERYKAYRIAGHQLSTQPAELAKTE